MLAIRYPGSSLHHSLVFGKTVTVSRVGEDRYGRTTANVFVNGIDINYELVKHGFAWWSREDAQYDRELERLESEARKARRPLWRDPNPVAPSEWWKDHPRPCARGDAWMMLVDSFDAEFPLPTTPGQCDTDADVRRSSMRRI